MGSYYADLSINSLLLDKRNPRIAELLERYDENDISPESIALALGAGGEDSYESLKNSIREYGGVINPIVVHKEDNGKYLVIEGNTRVQIYRKFINDKVDGSWQTIKAIVYENIEIDDIHAIRLQAHLIGAREWSPFAQAKYIHYLNTVEHMPISRIVEFCGGKSARIRDLIGAYQDLEDFYRPMCNDDSQLDERKFSSFIELQKPAITRCLAVHNVSKKEFVKWVKEDKFTRQEHIRRLPDILKSKEAQRIFLKDGSDSAIKVLNVEEYKLKQFDDVPYDVLAKALTNQLRNIKQSEVMALRDNENYEKYNCLIQVQESIEVVIDEVNKE